LKRSDFLSRREVATSQRLELFAGFLAISGGFLVAAGVVLELLLELNGFSAAINADWNYMQ
jgi:hypothetical protein